MSVKKKKESIIKRKMIEVVPIAAQPLESSQRIPCSNCDTQQQQLFEPTQHSLMITSKDKEGKRVIRPTFNAINLG
jgi:hypothetical protein